MNLISRQMLRRAIVLGLGIVGLALFVAGTVLERPSLAVAGLGFWLMIAIAVTLGMRQRMGAILELGELIRAEQAEARKSQGRLHARVAWLNRVRAEDRKRQQQDFADQRRVIEDGTSLSLRAFRAVDESLEEVRKHLRALENGAGKNDESLEEVRKRLQGLENDARKNVESAKATWQKLSHVIQKAEYGIVQEIEAMLYLQSLVKLPAPAPLLGGWAMDPMAMLKLVSWVLQAKPRLVVECGSGASTVWLAHALKANGGGKLISLEHQVHYADATRQALEQHGLTDVAEVLHAPLEDVQLGDQAYPWYAVDVVRKISGIEMLIIDGPPGASGALARYPALPVLESMLTPGALVVLDDAKREDERKIMERWSNEYPDLGVAIEIAPRTCAFNWKQGIG